MGHLQTLIAATNCGSYTLDHLKHDLSLAAIYPETAFSDIDDITNKAYRGYPNKFNTKNRPRFTPKKTLRDAFNTASGNTPNLDQKQAPIQAPIIAAIMLACIAYYEHNTSSHSETASPSAEKLLQNYFETKDVDTEDFNAAAEKVIQAFDLEHEFACLTPIIRNAAQKYSGGQKNDSGSQPGAFHFSNPFEGGQS